MNRLAVGTSLSFNYSENKSTDTQGNEVEQNGTAFFIGPFTRYYLKNGLFGQASFGFGTGRSESENFESSNDRFRYELGVGYAIFIGSEVSVEPLISYLHTRYKQDNIDGVNKSNVFTVGAGLTIYL